MEWRDLSDNRDSIVKFDHQWAKFREPLRREDQLVLDEMFRARKVHKEACDSMPELMRFQAVVVSMLIEQRKKSIRIEKQIEDLERRIRDQREDRLLSAS